MTLQSIYTGQERFGSSGNLGKNLNDTFVLNLANSIATIGFHITVPMGGSIIFEATFDDVHWEEVSMRSIDNDIFQHSTSENGNYIGSVAGMRRFRFRTSKIGSTVGTAIGKLQSIVSVIESIEFGNPPHRFGFLPMHKDASYTEAQTGADIWIPVNGKRFVVTDLDIICGGTVDATIIIFDEVNSSGNILFKGTIDVSNNRQFLFSHSYKTPYVSSTVDNKLKIVTSDDIDIDIIMHGYEV